MFVKNVFTSETKYEPGLNITVARKTGKKLLSFLNNIACYIKLRSTY